MIQDKLVEVSSAGLLTDILMNDFLREFLERHRIGQRLAAALQCEWNMNVANRESLAVDCAHGDAPIFWIDSRQLRNVRGDLSVGVALALPVNLFDVFRETEEVRNDKLVAKGSSDENDIGLDDAVGVEVSATNLPTWQCAYPLKVSRLRL